MKADLIFAAFDDEPHKAAIVEVNGGTPEEMLEDLYCRTQNFDNPWASQPGVTMLGNAAKTVVRHGGCRSTSVGDYAVVNGATYRCESVGWRKLDPGEVMVSLRKFEDMAIDLGLDYHHLSGDDIALMFSGEGKKFNELRYWLDPVLKEIHAPAAMIKLSSHGYVYLEAVGAARVFIIGADTYGVSTNTAEAGEEPKWSEPTGIVRGGGEPSVARMVALAAAKHKVNLTLEGLHLDRLAAEKVASNG